MTIDLDEFSSEKCLEWAAAWYEHAAAVREYVSRLHQAGTQDSELSYALSSGRVESALWYRMTDLFEGEFRP